MGSPSTRNLSQIEMEPGCVDYVKYRLTILVDNPNVVLAHAHLHRKPHKLSARFLVRLDRLVDRKV